MKHDVAVRMDWSGGTMILEIGERMTKDPSAPLPFAAWIGGSLSSPLPPSPLPPSPLPPQTPADVDLEGVSTNRAPDTVFESCFILNLAGKVSFTPTIVLAPEHPLSTRVCLLYLSRMQVH